VCGVRVCVCVCLCVCVCVCERLGWGGVEVVPGHQKWTHLVSSLDMAKRVPRVGTAVVSVHDDGTAASALTPKRLQAAT
jgi:hypothetical protein